MKNLDKWRQAGEKMAVMLHDAAAVLDERLGQADSYVVLQTALCICHPLSKWATWLWASTEIFGPDKLHSGQAERLASSLLALREYGTDTEAIHTHLQGIWPGLLRSLADETKVIISHWPETYPANITVLPELEPYLEAIDDIETIADSKYGPYDVCQITTRSIQEDDGSPSYEKDDDLSALPLGAIAMVIGGRLHCFHEELFANMESIVDTHVAMEYAQQRLAMNAALVRKVYERIAERKESA